MKTKQQTVAIGLSGGVDSAVSAALLKEQGYQVVGFFMKNWGDTFGLKVADCPWIQDREDAMRVAAKLDIPFHTLDFEEEYKKQVLDYFFSEYQAGRTPNPDVMCNSKIKFGVFLETALSLGADYIATGHYARLRREVPNSNFQEPKNNQNPKSQTNIESQDSNITTTSQLVTGVDTNKDQSYFLYRLNQQQLSKAMFPIGEYTKPKVRELAKQFGLPNFAKRDSQGVCFVGHIDLQKFLAQKIKQHPGDIVTVDGKKIGEHAGLFWYTRGQRKGINIGGTGPYFVLEKDFTTNRLVVTTDAKHEKLFTTKIVIGNINWISGFAPQLDKTYTARVRYREVLSECVIAQHTGDTYEITCTTPQWAVSAGQSMVLYDGDICIGGGIIE